MTFNQYMQITSGTYYILNSLIYLGKRQARRKVSLAEVTEEAGRLQVPLCRVLGRL